MLKSFRNWIHGCGHPEHSLGVPCRCRLIIPCLIVMLLSAVLSMVIKKHLPPLPATHSSPSSSDNRG